MKIIYTKYIPPKGFGAINLFGIIFARKGYGCLAKNEINHEKIHSYQILELLGVFFYLLYGIEWLFRMIQYRNFTKAYLNLSFEREAYQNMNNLDYLKYRKWFAFTHYYKKRNENN